jgi:hypothetical protein
MRTIDEKARCVEDAVRDDVATEMGNRFDSDRFIPFVVMHEFEGLLFSDCAAFSRGIERPDLEIRLREVRDGFATPEEINDSPDTAPSKRVEGLVPGYQKPLLGVLAVLRDWLGSHSGRMPAFQWLASPTGIARRLEVARTVLSWLCPPLKHHLSLPS